MSYKNVIKSKEDKMGFFKDFKRDFAQAVNELMPDKDELANEYDDEDMVNTFDDNDNMDIAPEDMLEDLDDYTIDDKIFPDESDREDEIERPETDYEDEEEEEEEDIFEKVPEAEIITESNDMPIEDSRDEILANTMVSELLNQEPTLDTDFGDEEEPTLDTDFSDEPENMLDTNFDDEQEEMLDEGLNEEQEMLDTDFGNEADDELVETDNLDEKDMLESIDEAMALDGDNATLQETILGVDLKDVDLNKAVEAALNPKQPKNAEEDEVEDMVVKTEEVDNIVKDKEQEVESILSNDTTYITKGTIIKGDIETEGGIDLIGEVQGNVTCAGKLIIGGTIKGNVKAGEIYANAAKIEGEITTEESVKIGVGSVVMGNIVANSAVVAGAVNGDIDVHGPVIVDSTAVIMGNIKSRSVQINNGAVIEGFCSQCYSEIDVKSFFE